MSNALSPFAHPQFIYPCFKLGKEYFWLDAGVRITILDLRWDLTHNEFQYLVSTEYIETREWISEKALL
jgi:hypothetical protein